MAIGLLTLLIELPGCASLKQKRSQVKPLLARLHREFNISAAEIDHLDRWQSAVLGCVVISNDSQHNQRVLQQVVSYVETNFPNLLIQQHRIESI
ncbi:uncharacterized protein conserved in bacteria [Longilinea arvoryzae]|uniref:Uncharacterized protein conserved in bacteria n=1 Tax=Longilinea arvoryzae TaxID=360412 RepID=A0A0S7BAD9_9CHLR|nr:DUF503 domain-containing protein [Longilinea arvoryzae]GAP14591.1 uncharacterized protein conserved in bacteria [Longilinea arvoryzae]